MAYICVHEQVIGTKLKLLSRALQCSQNEALGLLVRIWIWGVNHADSKGWTLGLEREDVVEAIKDGLREDMDPAKVVDTLIKLDWLFERDGINIHDWGQWQEELYKKLAKRERDRERKQKERAYKAIRLIESVEPTKEPEKQTEPAKPPEPTPPQIDIINPIEEPKVEETAKPASNGYTNEFEEWWKAYPRKVGKGDAYKKYKTRLKDGWSPEELLIAAKNYKARTIRDRTEEKYIKHPKTFLSDTTPFTDFIPSRDEMTAKAREDDNPYDEWRR